MADAFMKNTAALGPIPSHQPGATGNPLMATMAATEGASMPPEVTPTNPATPAPVAVAADPTPVATTAIFGLGPHAFCTTLFDIDLQNCGVL